MLEATEELRLHTMTPIAAEVSTTLAQHSKILRTLLVCQAVFHRHIREAKLAPPRHGDRDKHRREMA